MAKNIKTMVAGCNECLTYSVSKPKEPLVMTMADRPFEKISMDYGEYKKKYYLVVVDRYTVPASSVATKPILCTESPNYTMLFYYIKMRTSSSPSHPFLQLTGALK